MSQKSAIQLRITSLTIAFLAAWAASEKVWWVTAYLCTLMVAGHLIKTMLTKD